MPINVFDNIIMKVTHSIIILLFCLLSIEVEAQVDTINAPPAPIPPPPPRYTLSEEEKETVALITIQIDNHKSDLLAKLNNLIDISLNDKNFAGYRREVIHIIAKIPLIEAQLFLFEHIDMYIHEETSDRGGDPENYPCFEAIMNNSQVFDTFYVLNNFSLLEECANENKMKFWNYALKLKYNGVSNLSLILECLKTAKQKPNSCRKNNIDYMMRLNRNH